MELIVVKQNRKRPSSLYGGYDYTFVDDPPDDTICQICRLVAKEPSQMDCCGKIYCNSCLTELDEYLTSWLTCPNCRRAGKPFKDHRSERQIKSMKVMCTKAGQGCDWVGILSKLYDHTQKQCSHSTVECPRPECAKEVMASDLGHHLEEECPYRNYKCPDCQKSGPYQVIMTEHREQCPAVKVECPNGCESGGITRGSLEQHQTVCPMEVVACTYAEAGCEVRILRKELDKHRKDSLELHLGLAMDTVVSLKKKLTCMEKKVSKLEKEVDFTTKHPVAVFKIDRFLDRLDIDEEWSSPYFLTHPNGYKLCLNVIPNGVGEGESTHVSTSLWLSVNQTPNLLWPLSAKVKIELLNQLKDESHCSTIEEICEEPEPNIDGFNAEYVAEMLVSHNDLRLQESRGIQYLKDDCIYIRVSVELPESHYKPWLCSPPGKSVNLLCDF